MSTTAEHLFVLANEILTLISTVDGTTLRNGLALLRQYHIIKISVIVDRVDDESDTLSNLDPLRGDADLIRLFATMDVDVPVIDSVLTIVDLSVLALVFSPDSTASDARITPKCCRIVMKIWFKTATDWVLVIQAIFCFNIR